MEHLNRVEIIGTMRDLSVTNIMDTRVARFTVVVNDTFKSSSGETVTRPTFFSCVKFLNGDFGFKNGDTVHVLGRLKVETFSRSDGSVGAYFEVVANSVTGN